MSLSLLAAAKKVPERIGLVVDGVEISFAELAGWVSRALDRFATDGLEASLAETPALLGEPRVALVGESRVGALVELYALIEAGLPVLLVDPRLGEAERRGLLEPMRPTALLKPPWPAPCSGQLAACARSPFGVPDDERCLAVVFTSGSSGQPKGAVLSRRAFAASAAASAANLGWREEDRWLLSLPFAHVGGLSILTRCLVARRTVVVESLPRFDAAAVLAVVRERRITLLSLVPTQLRRLLNESPEAPATLRQVLLGGAAAPPELLAAAARGGWPVVATYGLTEACSQVTAQAAGEPPGADQGSGRPLPGVELRLRQGAIEVRGPTLMSGYFPESGDRPFDAEGWFATRDAGRLDEHGCLHVQGRLDEVVLSGGENVHPVEIEGVLRAFPGVRDACVFGIEDPEWGEVAVAALQADTEPDDVALWSFVRARLAPFKRPRQVAYLEEMPRTALGKIARRQAALEARPKLRPLDLD